MKSYPEYKNSGVKWTGKVPAHWEVSKVKFTSDCLDGLRIPLNAEQRGEMKGNIPYWGANGVVGYVNDYIFDEKIVLVGEDGAPFFDKRKDVAFTVNEKVWVNNHAHILRTKKEKIDDDFLKHILNTVSYEYYINGSTRDKLTQFELNNIRFSLPDIHEQKMIVRFLKNETSRIEKLISEKENFIKLLQEKRQALISHVVTKGLNPNVEMKDSGVEWIGEIPEHWEITKLRYLGQCQNGINIGGDSFGRGYPFVSYGDVYNNKALPKSVKGLVQSTEKDREIYSLKLGDVLFTRTSETIDEIGFSSVCHHDFEDAVFAGFLIRFRPKQNVIAPIFSEYYFQNEKLRAFFVKEMNLVTRASLSQDLLKRMPVTLPPKKEQQKIGKYINDKNEKFNELIKETKSSIELLREHRVALISAAVTGKIDVREEI